MQNYNYQDQTSPVHQSAPTQNTNHPVVLPQTANHPVVLLSSRCVVSYFKQSINYRIVIILDFYIVDISARWKCHHHIKGDHIIIIAPLSKYLHP